MDLRTGMGLALLVAGAILAVVGVRSFKSLDSEALSTAPYPAADRAIWVIVEGAITTVLGILLTITAG